MSAVVRAIRRGRLPRPGAGLEERPGVVKAVLGAGANAAGPSLDRTLIRSLPRDVSQAQV